MRFIRDRRPLAWKLLVVGPSIAVGVLMGCGDHGMVVDAGATTTLDATGSSSGGATTTVGPEDGSSTGSESTSETGGGETTGPPGEGEFDDVYRVAFYQGDIQPGSAYVDVDIGGSTAPMSLIPDLEGARYEWTLSPSGRWLFMRGGSDPAIAGWVVDIDAMEMGTPDDWAHPIAGELVTRPVFFPAEDGLAYIAEAAGANDIEARTLGDELGAPVVVDTAAANVVSLAGFDDQLLFVTADEGIHVAPAAAVAGAGMPVADGGPAIALLSLFLSSDGSAVYAVREDTEDWFVAPVDPVGTPALSPIELAPQPSFVPRSTYITRPRNRIVVLDSDDRYATPDPLSYVTLDGTTASAPVFVPIPAGPNGTYVGTDLVLGADGDRLYIVATTEAPGRAAYVVDLSRPDAPTMTAVAGPGIDDATVDTVLLSHDEQRLFYTTSEPTYTVKMVDLAGGLPVDLAPDLAYADGVPGTTLVESADGRAIFFLGQESVVQPFDQPQKIYRVGIVDGVPTPPVAMSDEAGERSPLYLVPAPDGGALVYWERGTIRLAMYGDGEPEWYEVTTFYSISYGPPIFLPLP